MYSIVAGECILASIWSRGRGSLDKTLLWRSLTWIPFDS